MDVLKQAVVNSLKRGITSGLPDSYIGDGGNGLTMAVEQRATLAPLNVARFTVRTPAGPRHFEVWLKEPI